MFQESQCLVPTVIDKGEVGFAVRPQGLGSSTSFAGPGSSLRFLSPPLRHKSTLSFAVLILKAWRSCALSGYCGPKGPSETHCYLLKFLFFCG
jgi:hypothetical protein